MGTQQILLVILGVIVIGVAIAVGIAMFGSSMADSNKEAIINDLMNVGQYAYRYKLTPVPFGGGGRVYTGFVIPEKLRENENASYVATPSGQSCVFVATSKAGFGTVTSVLDSSGTMGTYSYVGTW
jgi:hypothetical protein